MQQTATDNKVIGASLKRLCLADDAVCGSGGGPQSTFPLKTSTNLERFLPEGASFDIQLTS